MAPTTQVNSATLIIGPTGTGKSSLARTMANYLWEEWRKVLYYYTCDGGGYPAPVQEGIALGIIKVFRMRTRDPGTLNLAFETCYRACQGYWPRRINPATGEVEPGVEMVAPIVKRIAQICPNGHLVKYALLPQHLTPQACPTCGVLTTVQNMSTRQELTHSKGFEDRGGVFFDGLTSMLSWGTMELGQRAGRLELGGEEGAIGGKVISGELRFGGTTRSHIGFMQARGEEMCHLALGIPNLFLPPVFTALTDETTDDAALPIVGPKISGHAKTDEAPQWVGNCLEATKRQNPNGAGEQFALLLEEFTDERGRKHLIKHRGSPGTMPKELADPPDGSAPFQQFNLGVFFRLLDAALRAGIAQAKQQYPDAPGVTDGIAEYGDGGGASAPQPAAQGGVPAPVGRPATLQAPPPTQAAPPPAPAAPVAVAAPTPIPAAPPVEAPAAKPRTRGKAAAAPVSTPPPAVPAPATAPVAAQAGPPTPIAQPAAPSQPAPAMPAAAPASPVAAPVAPPVVAAPAAPAAPRVGIAPPPGARPPAPAATARPAAPRPPAPPAVPKA